jgi:hypothetical protein
MQRPATINSMVKNSIVGSILMKVVMADSFYSFNPTSPIVDT